MYYTVKTEQFEGPLDLLLGLIEKNELDITEVSLAAVADQYVEYIESSADISIENMADFLSVAAKLLLLKSRALLPTLELDEEEEDEIEDLEEQIKWYKKFKEVSEEIGKRLENENRSYARKAFIGTEKFFSPDLSRLELTVRDIRAAFGRVLAAIPDPEKLKEKIISRTIRLEEKVNQLRALIARKTKCLFSELSGRGRDRADTTITFLAVLELVRSRKVDARQEKLFTDIEIYRL